MGGHSERIGIVAGGGSLPGEVAASIVRRGGSVFIVMVEGAADPALVAHPHTAINWAQLGHAVAALKDAGVAKVILLGAFSLPSLIDARPDLGFFYALPSILRLLRAGGDDAVLRGLVALFERQGLPIVGVRDIADDLLVGNGPATTHRPSAEAELDIVKGFALIAALGRYDIGQAAVVVDGQVEAIEGVEGTDRMLKRVAAAREGVGQRRRAGVLVKRPKPGQDLRVDLPAIGPNTVKNAADAGLSGIAVMAGHVLAAQRSAMIELAEASGLFVTGIEEAPWAIDRSNSVIDGGVTVLGSTRADRRQKAEIDRAVAILSTLENFQTGSAIVIDRGRVLAVGADEAPLDVITRAASIRRARRRRRGLAAVGVRCALGASVIRSVADANLAGIVKLAGGGDAPIAKDDVRFADKLGLLIAAAHICRQRRSKP